MNDERKPDGWHTYHICGGKLRSIERVKDDADNASLMCLVCGEWFDWTVSQEPVPSA